MVCNKDQFQALYSLFDLHLAVQYGSFHQFADDTNLLVVEKSQTISLLSKIRHYVLKHLLRTIYFSIFNSHLIYACEIWGQNQKSQHFKKLLKLRKSTFQIIINFQPPTATTNHLFLETKTLKIADFIKYRYALFVRSSLRKEGVPLFNDMFTTTSNNHNPIMRGSVNYLLNIPQGKTIHFGDYSIRSTTSKVWNNLYRFSNCNLLTCKNTEFKNSIQQIFLDKYSNGN